MTLMPKTSVSPLPSPLRDPNLMETLDVYDGSAGYLKELELGGDELTKVGEGDCRVSSYSQLQSNQHRILHDQHPLTQSHPTAPYKQAIIGTMGDIDSYQLPDAKGSSALSRHLLGVTDEERQQRRDEILGTSAKDFK